MPFNSLPNSRFLGLSKLKAFAVDETNVTLKLKFFFGGLENIVEKGGNAGNQHFLLFPQCFQKASCSGSSKVGIVWLTGSMIKTFFYKRHQFEFGTKFKSHNCIEYETKHTGMQPVLAEYQFLPTNVL